MHLLIDLQPLQTRGAANRGVGKVTNGMLRALASAHDVIGLKRHVPYLVQPAVEVPTLEVRPGGSTNELEEVIAGYHFDAVLNCSSPYGNENVIVADLKGKNRPLVASIFYDATPWIFPDVYLPNSETRQGYHNRCVELYARADLVCAISQHSEQDARRFGYANRDTAITVSLGVEPVFAEATDARHRWNIHNSYLLTVSGDDFRKNPETLIAAYLKSGVRESLSLVIVISNDVESEFLRRLESKFGNLRPQNVIILSKVAEGELGALYRDCAAFVVASFYEGFGIPIVEAMHAGKWIVSPATSGLAEVIGPALLALVEDPTCSESMIIALEQAERKLKDGLPDDAMPRGYAQKYSWSRVCENFEKAVMKRREALAAKPAQAISIRPRLFWASPFPQDISGIAFFSEDLVELMGEFYDLVLVPNSVSTFVPTSKTGRFKIAGADPDKLLILNHGERPRVVYNIGNSHFHLNLLELLFKLPGIVLLHDSFVGGLESFWRERVAGLEAGWSPLSTRAGQWGASRWLRKLSKVDRLLNPIQATRFRVALSKVARLPGMRVLLLRLAKSIRGLLVMANTRNLNTDATLKTDDRPLDIQIIESSRALVFLSEYAQSLIAPEHLAKRPVHVVPLYCRYRGTMAATKRTELRQKYGIAEEAFVITTAGFQTRLKLADRVIRSCIELQSREAAKCYVQVLGHFFDSNLEAEVESLLTENNVPSFVSSGFLPEASLTERLAVSDVAVFLREWPTGAASAALNDALGAGVPCLVSDNFGFREYPNTAVFRIANTELTEGLLLLYRHPQVRYALAAGALEYAEGRSVERTAAKLRETLGLYD